MTIIENLSRKKELETLRLKIVDAIRYSTSYWMIFKEKTFGIATILDIIYKRSYIEVLFFTKYDVLNFSVPLLKISTPIETEVDFNEILLEPDIDDDGLVSPKKIIQRLNNLIKNEINHHIAILDEQIMLIQEKYENYTIEDNPYKRVIFIHFKNFYISLKVDFEKYPLAPKFSFSKYLSKLCSLNQFLDKKFFKNWDSTNAPNVIECIDLLVGIILEKQNFDKLPNGSQHVILENLTVNSSFRKISFKILRGQSIGIIYSIQYPKKDKEISNPLDEFFQAISGKNTSFNGKIKIFGKNVQLLLKSEMEKIVTISSDTDVSFGASTIFRKMIKNYHPKFQGNETKKSIQDSQLKIKIGKFPKIWTVYEARRRRSKKDYISKILKLTSLYDRKNEKIKKLSKLEQILFQISNALLQKPFLILLSLSSTYLGRLEIEKLNKSISNIERKFHVSFIIHGSKDVISSCDQVMTITEEKIDIGSVEDYVHKLPQSGEIITVELSNPDRAAVKEMRSLDSVFIIEERRNEKYKLFVKEDPEIILLYLLELFGPKLYNFKRFKATLGEYIEFLEGRRLGTQYKLR
ncbi:MAG: hypothetical protein JW891_02260 [Candidatus Lokiarchaeota archaeon]|nr:hypothetical protein [Candidatus Lokiarchaeota archaeon]